MNGFNEWLDRHFTPATKTIFLINVVVFLGLNILNVFKPGFAGEFIYWFGQNPWLSLRRGYIWQFLTYNFIQYEVFHILFNMLILYFFAPTLENRWGTRFFWFFYLITGIGAGLFHAIFSMFHFDPRPVIGASGAIMGVMLAFAAYFPDQVVLFWGVWPVKIKNLVIILILFEVFMMAGGGMGNISHLTHLTGLAIAYLLLARYHRDWDIRHWRWR